MSRVARGKSIKSYLSSRFCGEVLYLVEDSLVAAMRLYDLPNVEGKCNQQSDEEAEVDGWYTPSASHRTLPIDFPPKPCKPAYQTNIVDFEPLSETLLEG